MAGTWIISVAGRTYGPYTTEQMQSFASEGRLARQSLIARTGETDFRSAGDEPALAAIFSPSPDSREDTALQSQRRETLAGFGRGEEPSRTGQRSHFVILADLKSGSIAKLEDAIATFGPSYAILPQAWLLYTDESVNIVRNRLIQQLGKLDVLFVADAGNDKAAWFNFGPEADARIRKLWSSDPKLRAAG
jgi:hypothetical protein